MQTSRALAPFAFAVVLANGIGWAHADMVAGLPDLVASGPRGQSIASLRGEGPNYTTVVENGSVTARLEKVERGTVRIEDSTHHTLGYARSTDWGATIEDGSHRGLYQWRVMGAGSQLESQDGTVIARLQPAGHRLHLTTGKGRPLAEVDRNGGHTHLDSDDLHISANANAEPIAVLAMPQLTWPQRAALALLLAGGC